VWGIGTRGEITFEHTYTDGLHAQVSSNQDDIVLRAKVTESVGVIRTHNHPHGTDPSMTEDDSRSTSELARRLQPLGIVLLASSVVSPPAQPPIQENRGRGYIPEIDACQARCQEYDRLWAPYGGKRPAWAGGR
jgi:RadC-like JAB domain